MEVLIEEMERDDEALQTAFWCHDYTYVSAEVFPEADRTDMEMYLI